MKLYKKMAVILAGCMVAVGISSTWAFYSDTKQIVNSFHTTNSALHMVEKFNPAEMMLPGETVKKEPSFENKGNLDLIVRVKATSTWEQKELKPEMVKYTLGSGWIASGEYYYYSSILEKDEKTSPLMTEVKLSPDVSNDSHEADYSNCTFAITFEANAVPADSVSLQASGWGISQADTELEQADWYELLSNR